MQLLCRIFKGDLWFPFMIAMFGANRRNKQQI